MTELVPVTRSALRWYGGKWRLAPWIIGHFPPHVAYCEPYGGAASVLLRKPPSKIETWNDLNSRLVSFFRTLREREQDLVRAIELTPYAREEYELAHQQADDPLEDARRFYVLTHQGRAGAGSGRHRSGWRYERNDNRTGGPVADEFTAKQLPAVAARLKHVQIEHDDAPAVITRYDTPATLFYVDPPYVGSTRSHAWAHYVHELSDDDHRALAAQLHQVAGMVALSGYPSALYDELYADWHQVRCMATVESSANVPEVLWLSPAARNRIRQLSFEEGTAG